MKKKHFQVQKCKAGYCSDEIDLHRFLEQKELEKALRL